MDIILDKINKRYDAQQIFHDFSLTLTQGKTYLLTGASGVGKTTLLHILFGLVKPDSGTVTADVRYTGVFQENRLLPNRTAVENVQLVAAAGTKQETLSDFLSQILPSDCLDKPIEELSGGMQRRVAIARAMLPDSDCVVMDEPFTGLDEQTVQTVVTFIFRHLRGRTLILSTHQPEALDGYPAEHIRL